MSESPPSPKKIKLESIDLDDMSKEELILKLKEQDKYVRHLEEKTKARKGDEDYKELEAKLKQHQRDAARKEHTLVHRLTTKEQELQDYINQIQEFKQAQTQNTAQLKSMLLDPAVNLVFQRMTKEMEDSQEKLRQTQNELSAWKFTSDSQTGKRLMAKCRMLIQENEELGKVITSGRTAKLEGEIATQKEFVTEMKTNQSELDEFLGDLDEDVEGMQSMIYVLQQQLKDAKDQITQLQTENSRLKCCESQSELNSRATVDKNPVVVGLTQDRTSPSLQRTPPILNDDENDQTSPITRAIKSEKTSPSEKRDLLHDRQTDIPSEEESMDTDSFSVETKTDKQESINHHHRHSSKSKVPSHVVNDNSQNYDSMEDSQDGWSSPTPHDTEGGGLNGQKLLQSRDSTPEMDSLPDKNFSLGGEGLQNGMTRTPVKTEEIGEA